MITLIIGIRAHGLRTLINASKMQFPTAKLCFCVCFCFFEELVPPRTSAGTGTHTHTQFICIDARDCTPGVPYICHCIVVV